MRCLFCVCCLVLTIVGCGGGINTDYSGLNLVDVSGTVTLDDEPVVGAVVIFEAEDGSSSSATTGGGGEYELMFNSEQSGVTQGPKTIRISTSMPASDEDVGGEEDGEEEDGVAGENGGELSDVERIPACYNVDSKLTTTVTDDSGRMDFNLRSDCSTAGPAE